MCSGSEEGSYLWRQSGGRGLTLKTTWKAILGCLPANVVPVIHVMYSLHLARGFRGSNFT